MNGDIIEMTSYTNNISVTIDTDEPEQNNSKFYGRLVATIKKCSFIGFVIGGSIGALIGVPITYAKGFKSSYLDISRSSAVVITLTTYCTGCLIGAYYKVIFNVCKKITAIAHTPRS